MINPNGSNIPKARLVLQTVLDTYGDILPQPVRNDLIYALKLMTRQRALRRADTQQKIGITPAMKRDILSLKDDHSLSLADIAELVGLPHCASGRVSEVLSGLR